MNILSKLDVRRSTARKIFIRAAEPARRTITFVVGCGFKYKKIDELVKAPGGFGFCPASFSALLSIKNYYANMLCGVYLFPVSGLN
jgi:hypothetical protein